MQYGINTEAAKRSVLSSGNIDQYGYLTGEEILPSDQRRVIEKGKFVYSPLGKVLEKPTKFSGKKEYLELLKQKEISNKLVTERKLEIYILSEWIDFNNLSYCYKAKGAPKYFIRFKGPLIIKWYK